MQNYKELRNNIDLYTECGTSYSRLVWNIETKLEEWFKWLHYLILYLRHSFINHPKGFYSNLQKLHKSQGSLANSHVWAIHYSFSKVQSRKKIINKIWAWVAQKKVSHPMITLPYETIILEVLKPEDLHERLLKTVPKESWQDMEVSTVYHGQHVHLLHVQICKISSPNLARWWHS